MAALRTARHRALVTPRSIRRSRSLSRQGSFGPAGSTAAVQFFLSRLDHFLGTELFAADEPIVIGRHRDSLLRLKEAGISRRHLTVQLEGDRLILEDLGSANGTLVNGRRIAGKVEVQASDAIQIGSFTLRVRALIPASARARASSGVSEEDTKVEAVLSVEGSNGSVESHIPIQEEIDWRLYEDAIRRATGAEPARNVVPFRPIGEQSTSADEDLEHHATNRDPQPDFALERRNEPRTYRTIDIDSAVAARIDELDRAVGGLRPAVSVAIALEQATREAEQATSEAERRFPSMPIRSEEDERVWSTPTPVIAGSRSPTPFEIIPSQGMLTRERDALEASDGSSDRSSDGSSEDSVEIGESSIERALPAQAQAPAQAKAKANHVADSMVARTLLGPAGAPETSISRQTSVGSRREPIPARLVTPSQRGRGVAVPSPGASQARAPRGARAIPAPGRRPPPPVPQPSRSMASLSTLASRFESGPSVARPRPAAPLQPISESDSTEEIAEADMRFDAVEISARTGERLLDISTLRREGEQYVLGHRTPQGAVAPHAAHPGLRLLKVSKGRFVDLVFPGDVAGHLVRDGETVMLRELTEGRKYSSLRLKARDVVTVILGEGPGSVSYHVRFLRTPRAVTRVGR
ncbi:MAG: FHA domain-containing protein [Deltaproteobacteria bacterium]|nr:FHA domain-containing protein [Deltaproteobacteria bacterium]